MKKFETPEVSVEDLKVYDVITTSLDPETPGGDDDNGTSWG